MDSTATGERRSNSGALRAVGVAIGLTIAGLVGGELVATPGIVALEGPAVLTEENYQIATETFVIAFALSYVGMAIVGAIYLYATGRGARYVDVGVPSLRDWLWALAGVFGAIGLVIVVGIVGQLLDTPGADHQLIGMVEADPSLALILIVLVFLFNAPVEEFLFRNVIQKRLYDAFTKLQSVVVVSAVFALVHLPVYFVTTDALASVGVSLLVIFGGSLVFGYLFVRTENLIVPTLAHAGLNSFQFLYLYVLLEYFPEEYEAAQAATLSALPVLVASVA